MTNGKDDDHPGKDNATAGSGQASGGDRSGDDRAGLVGGVAVGVDQAGEAPCPVGVSTTFDSRTFLSPEPEATAGRMSVSLLPDGSIHVKNAPLPFMTEYIVRDGEVWLTPELAKEAEKYGWRLTGETDVVEATGLVVVSRS